MAKEPKAPVMGKKKGLSLTCLISFAVIIGLVVFYMATFILLIIGLLPTFASLLTDKSHLRTQTFCVGSLNLAGLFPYLIELWGGANDMAAALEAITSVFSLFIIYGAAAFGFMVFSSVPAMIGSFLTVVNERRMKVLRKTQRSLIKEWGEAVADSGLPNSDNEPVKTQAPPPPSDAAKEVTKANA